MKKTALFVLLLAIVFITESPGITRLGNEIFDRIKLTDSDIPKGFTYGQIPEFAVDVFKKNPGEMDKKAIQKIADDIYPGGDYNNIAGIHVTILARTETPHGDDIVCYIILYKDAAAAREELKKITEYVGYNKDRAILHSVDNLVFFLHVDDTKNFHYIEEMNMIMMKKLGNG